MSNRARRVRYLVPFVFGALVAGSVASAIAQSAPDAGTGDASPATAPSAAPPTLAVDQPADFLPAPDERQEQRQDQPRDQPLVDHPGVPSNPDAVPPPPTPNPPAQSPPAELPAKRLRTIPADEAAGVLGKKVLGAAGEDIGLVVDILIDDGGHPRAALIDFGGFLGVGSRKIAVDWKLLQFRPGDRGAPVLLDVTRDAIQAAPEYRPSGDTPGVVVSPPEPEAPPADSAPEQAAVPEELLPAAVDDQPASAESDGSPPADAVQSGPADGVKLQTKIPKDRPKRLPSGEIPLPTADPGPPPAPSAQPTVPSTPPDARQ